VTLSVAALCALAHLRQLAQRAKKNLVLLHFSTRALDAAPPAYRILYSLQVHKMLFVYLKNTSVLFIDAVEIKILNKLTFTFQLFTR
jgi:hypothetical protein